jgi:ribosomal protein S20
MPLLKSSIKANNQNIKRRQRNNSFRRGLKNIIKLISESIKKNDLKTAEQNMSLAYSEIDKAIKRIF